MKHVVLLTILIPLFLKGQTIVHQEDFSAGLGTWTNVDVLDATDTWSATSGYAEMNGFGGSDDEDWLISPSINLDTQSEEYFLFDYNDNYNGAMLEVYYSLDYNGGGAPTDVTTATWIQLNDKLININTTSCFSTLFQRHPAIDISNINGTSVYFAFRYQGTSSSSKDYKIDNIRILADYYAGITPNINCCDLNAELHNLISTQTDRIRYTSTNYDVWDAILHTDVRLNDSGTDTIIWDMFTDVPSGAGDHEFERCNDRDQGGASLCTTCYNREHTFPRSWWGGGTTLSDTINTDMHHIVPSERNLNSAKSNQPPGVVLTATTTGANGFQVGGNNTYTCSSINYYEPIDEYKGDYARMYFYIATRYKHNMTAWEPLNTDGDCALNGDACTAYEPWLIDVLLDWHENDPVSAKEIDRNNTVYAIQGNRNPYIDYPNWVQYIWGDASGTACSDVVLPIELTYFKAKVEDEKNVHLTWQTTSELNNDYFLIQRSKNPKNNWEVIGRVQGKGTTQSTSNYSFMDTPALPSTYYYRLKQVDFDGNSKTTQIKTAQIKRNDATFYPNPVKGIASTRFLRKTEYSISVFNPRGEILIQKNGIGSSVEIDFSKLNPGIYFVKVKDFSNSTEQIIKVVKI